MARTDLVSWDELSKWLDSAAAAFDHEALVGVSRGGAALAIALSYRLPRIPLHFMYRDRAAPAKGAFYVFQDGRAARVEETKRAMRVTEGLAGAHRVMVVDDVATFGDTLGIVDDVLIANRVQHVDFAVYAVDRTVLERENPSVLERVVACALDIDNSEVWLTFPWQAAEAVG